MFPRLDASRKDRSYHLDWAKAILTSSITDNWSFSYRVMAESYKFFNSGSSGELAGFLQKAEDGQDLPAMWLTMSPLKSKIETLIGELEERGYEIRVRGLNKEIVSRKMEEKERLRVQRRLQPIAKFAEAQTGLPVQQEEYIPQTDRELDEYADLKVKDKAEIIMEAALKFCAKYNDWDDARKALFRDVWIANKAITRSEIVRGIPRDIRVDPLCFIFDPNATNDNLSDSTYFGEVYYMGLGEAAERYNLSKEELETAYGAYNQFIGIGAGNANFAITNVATETFYTAVPDRLMPWFKTVNNVPRVLVARTCWSDFKIRKFKSEVNAKYGTEHLQEITEDVRKRGKSNIITQKLNVWRQCTLIGGSITREWGECPNQARDLSDLEKTEPPYKVWIPNFLMGSSVSKTEQVVGIELLRDMAMYNFQLAMNRAGGKGFIYDMALKPDNMTFEQVIGYLKVSGIIPVNSKEYQMTAGGMNVLKDIDLSITDSIGKYLEIMAFLDGQVNMILGTSPERQGIIPAASQAVGVSQLAVAGSSAVTKTYFLGFERFCSRVLNHQAKQIKIAWADREVFAPIIGDTGIDFLKENIDLDLDEFAVFVESLPPLIRDRQKLEELITLAVQAQQMTVVDALEILTEPDTRVAIRKLQRKEAIRQMLAAKNQQAEQQQEAALQLKLQEQETQRAQDQLRGQAGLQKLKDEGQLTRVLATGRTKLNEKKIDLLAKPR
jgi:hypothetical protein